jgi:murein DD-endopeptidase MepM/ murein hydrolase activator NlpD
MAALGLLIAIVAILTRPRPVAPVTVEIPEVVDVSWRSNAFRVQPGEIMTSLFRRAGINPATGERLIEAFKRGGFNFRRMRPGDSLILMYRDGELDRVLYRRNLERVYRLDLEPDDCRVSMSLRLVRRTPSAIRGDIETSLYEAMLDLGEKPALIADYADIFGWEIDFFCETQQGDSFTVLVERKTVDADFIGYGNVLVARYRGAVGDFRAYRFRDPDGRTDFYNSDGECMRKTFLKSPLHFTRVTSYFGRRYHPIRRRRMHHAGVDYAAPVGTPVSCVAAGHVTFCGWNGGYGNLVEVTHPGGYKTRYGHLSRFGKGIRSGVSVAQNRVVGYVGSTGISTGPHLHYEVRKFDSPVNPLRVDAPRVDPVKEEHLDLFRAVRDSLDRLLERPGPLITPRPQPDQGPS